MAIAYDNAGSTSSASNVSSLTTASWTIAGSDRILVAGMLSAAGTRATHSTCKWGGSGGTGLTQIGTSKDPGPYLRVSQWRLVAPTAASQTLYCSFSANQDETALGGASYTGVDQTTPLGTQVTATGTTGLTSTVSGVSSATGELVVDVVGFLDINTNITAITPGGSQTARVSIANVGGLKFESFGLSEKAGAASVTMTWTLTSPGSTDTDWAGLAVPLKPVSSGSNGFLNRNYWWENY